MRRRGFLEGMFLQLLVLLGITGTTHAAESRHVVPDPGSPEWRRGIDVILKSPEWKAFQKRLYDEPAFTVWNRTRDSAYRVYANGRIEGFGDSTIIMNGMLLVYYMAETEWIRSNWERLHAGA